MSCALWDTAGLNEGSEGTVPAEEAERNLRAFMEALSHSGGIHLVIYCIRGARLTRALKRNYDLFYVTVCRRKVSVALVVTCLEHQKGGMETWWTQNEAELRRARMQFDAHACVTAVDAGIEDQEIQKRRSESQQLLRELVFKYSALPGWKTDPSFMSRVLPLFRIVFRRLSYMNSPENTATVRKVICCGDFTRFILGTSTVWHESRGKIGNTDYAFLQVDKNAVRMITPEKCVGVGLLVFQVTTLVDNCLSSADVGALKEFHDLAGGQSCPVIVLLLNCSDKEVAWQCRIQITSHHRDIRPHVVAIAGPDAREKMVEITESHYLEQVEGKAQTRTITENTQCGRGQELSRHIL